MNDDNQYIGTALINGRLCHRWLDGTVLPVLFGGAGEDDDDGDDGDDGDGDGANDDDDGDEDDDGDGEGDGKKGKKSSAEDRNRAKASREAAKYRVRAKERTAERDEARQELATVKAELEKLKKDGVTDATVKAELEKLREENAKLQKDVDGFKAKQTEAHIMSQISDEMEDLSIDADPDYVYLKLKKNDMLNVDEDGDIEGLTASLKKLLKRGVLKSAGGDDDDDADGKRSGGASTATRTGRAATKRNGTKKGGADKAALVKKYPALRGR